MTLLKIDTDDFLRAISVFETADPDAVEAFKQQRAEWIAGDDLHLVDAPTDWQLAPLERPTKGTR